MPHAHETFRQLLRDQGRGVMGALIFGTPFLFTMETWWLGWTLPAEFLVVYTLIGLAIVVTLARAVGFREAEESPQARPPLWRLATNVSELVLQAFLAGYAVLLIFGVIEPGHESEVVARLGLIQLIPLAFGAALANRLLAGTEENSGEAAFPKDLAIFAMGGLFFTFPIAPTEEMELMAAHAGWARLSFAIAAALLVTHLALYEVEFRGQQGRLIGMSFLERVGETALVYAVAFATSFFMLAAFGHFTGEPPAVWVQLSIVLAFPASLGGAAARVVL